MIDNKSVVQEGNEDFKDKFKRLLKKFKIFIAFFIFTVGIAIYIFSALKEGFFWGVTRDFGIFLAASVAIPFVYEIFLRAEDREIYINDLSDVLNSKINILIPDCHKYGLVGFDDKLDFSSLFDGLNADCELLWLDTYCPSFKDFLTDIEKAIKKGASVRMLVIDPECENARNRALEIEGIHFEPDIFCKEIENFIENLERCDVNELNNSHGSLEIRSYSDLPCIPMYIILNKNKPIRGYTSYFLTKPTAYFVHSEWTAIEGGLLEYFHGYFEQKWSNHAETTLFKKGQN